MIKDNPRLEKIKKYMSASIICLVIFLLFSFTSYDTLNLKPQKTIIEYDGSVIKLYDNIEYINGETYISAKDVMAFFESDVYFDKISRKLIFTTSKKLQKIKLIQSNENEVIHKEGDYYININKIAEIYDKTVVYIEKSNTIILRDKIIEKGIIKNRGTSVYYYKHKNKVYDIELDKNQEIEFFAETDVFQSEWIKIKFKYKGKESLGYVLRKYVKIDYSDLLGKVKVINKDNLKDFVMIRLEGQIQMTDKHKNVNSISIDLFETEGSKGKVRENQNRGLIKELRRTGTALYGVVSNNYDAGNFDNNILSQLLASDINRENLINNLSNKALQNKLTGIVLDFKNMKIKDKELYTQFVKECSARFKEKNIVIGVIAPMAEYIAISEISKEADFVILQAYDFKTIYSKVSGPTSSVSDIQIFIEKISLEGADLTKIILEVPMHSILWIEKKDVVYNTERYYTKDLASYLLKNKLNTKRDNNARQNYIEYDKEDSRYTMWFEDAYSLNNKFDFLTSKQMLGISIYNADKASNKIWEVINAKI